MRTVYKYEIKTQPGLLQKLKVYGHPEVVHVGLDPRGIPCLWIETTTEAKPRDMHVIIRGTGEEIFPPEKHIGSFMSGPYIWHVFDCT